VTGPLSSAGGISALLVGTEKGLFRLRFDARGGAQIEGPHLAGYTVRHVVAAPGRPLEWLAAVDHAVWGSHLHRSRDGGTTWTGCEAAPQHPPGRHREALKAIWHLAWSPDGRRLHAGIDPAGLFRSDDGGATWQDVPAINEHATRSYWEPSRGLFALHSICIDSSDAARLVVAVSAGGAYRSTDGGASWAPANQGVRAEHLPERYPVAGHNVHRIVMHPRDGCRLYRQCYNGTYRSDDGGATWTEITAGLPSDFGYAIACDPFDPDAVWQIPVSSSHLRTAADGKLRVFRSRDGGRSWASASAGLPQQHAYVSALRDAMDVDPDSRGRVAFGTTSGHVFLTGNDGDDWSLVAEYLPRVLSVRFAASGK
jgi:photosystem II stability/assembly factor-like uncharacterized protein